LNVVIHSIELCAGVGMLGEGVRAAFKHLGFAHRTVCYVEREASAAGQLVALMEAGALDSAPVWSDLITFDGAAWRGLVDCVIAGFPCQDLSVAGKRAGLDGKRSGLFFNVADIADACGARFLILENVSGIASASASVVDETEGDLEERAASRVLGELADRGWDAEWMHLRASDVGASHERNRWFCLAWRNMVDAVRNVGHRSGDRESRSGRRIREASTQLGDAESNGRHQRRPESGREQGRSDASEYGRSTNDLFAPGPLDDRWAGIVADRPDLAPATKPGVRMLAHGMACLLDESRNHQLRQVGNGVVAAQAAYALVTLARRAGIFE
jgi:DNA (cytosine-5)-methyltransferase 1